MLRKEPNYYPMGAGAGSINAPCRPSSVTERLMDEKTSCERRLEEVNAALLLLERNPNVAEVLEVLTKMGF